MKVESYLSEKGVTFEKALHSPCFTSQELAAREHVSGYYVAKPVVVKGSKDFVICVVPACSRLNLGRVADVLGEDEVRLATESEMANLFSGCELGAEPPIGSMFGMRTVLDSKLHEDEFLVMQAGKHTDSIRVRRDDYERVCEPTVATITY